MVGYPVAHVIVGRRVLALIAVNVVWFVLLVRLATRLL
jgi:hypothetical protein